MLLFYRQPENLIGLKHQDLTSNLRNSFLTVIPTLSKSLSHWVTFDSHWGRETRILTKDWCFSADLQNKRKQEFRFRHLTDLLFGLLEFVWLVSPQQLGLGLSLLLQRALSLLPSLPRSYALVETSLRTRATPGDPVSSQTPAGNQCSHP